MKEVKCPDPNMTSMVTFSGKYQENIHKRQLYADDILDFQVVYLDWQFLHVTVRAPSGAVVYTSQLVRQGDRHLMTVSENGNYSI